MPATLLLDILLNHHNYRVRTVNIDKAITIIQVRNIASSS